MRHAAHSHSTQIRCRWHTAYTKQRAVYCKHSAADTTVSDALERVLRRRLISGKQHAARSTQHAGSSIQCATCGECRKQGAGSRKQPVACSPWRATHRDGALGIPHTTNAMQYAIHIAQQAADTMQLGEGSMGQTACSMQPLPASGMQYAACSAHCTSFPITKERDPLGPLRSVPIYICMLSCLWCHVKKSGGKEFGGAIAGLPYLSEVPRTKFRWGRAQNICTLP